MQQSQKIEELNHLDRQCFPAGQAQELMCSLVDGLGFGLEQLGGKAIPCSK